MGDWLVMNSVGVRGFESIREAKDYLASRIVAEAKREGTPLTEVERKMLYFSEEGWTLPDMMEVNAEFERDYDEDEYERKIAGLVRKIEASDTAQSKSGQETWDLAVEKLSEGDHYLLVLLDPSLSSGDGSARPPHDRLKLWLTAFGIVFGVLGLTAVLNSLFGPKFWAVADWVFDRDHFGFLVLSLAAVFWLLNWRFGPRFRTTIKGLLNRE